MKEWTCSSCNYTVQSDNPPERCPRCGYPGSQFYSTDRKGGCLLLLVCLILLPISLLCTLVSCRPPTMVDNTPVTKVELNRYLGRWYEVARYDHRFERGMTHCTATYTLQDNGTIKVINQGLKNGEWKVSRGKAKLTRKPGLLRVSFFGPFYSDYRILMLAPDYSYALVGSSSEKYLWILSRTPLIKLPVRAKILREVARRGYSIDNLIWVDQKSPTGERPNLGSQ